MEAAFSFETQVHYQTIWRPTSQADILHIHRYENLKCHILVLRTYLGTQTDSESLSDCGFSPLLRQRRLRLNNNACSRQSVYFYVKYRTDKSLDFTKQCTSYV
jgi:hypothetical protein